MTALQKLSDPKYLIIPKLEAETLLDLYLQTKAESTRIKYLRTFKKYFRDYGTFSVKNLQMWYSDLTCGEYSQKYQATQYYTLKSFFTYLNKMNALEFNPLDVYKLKKATKVSHHRPLSYKQIAKIYAPKLGTHEIAMLIRLQLLTGMRSHEVLSIPHFAFKKRVSVLIVVGKGGKARRLKLNEECRRYIKRLEKYPQIFAKSLSAKDVEQATRNYRARLKTFNRQKDIEHFSSHQLRATFATKLYEHGSTIETVAKILGHATIETTKSYIAALSEYTPVQMPTMEDLYSVPKIKVENDNIQYGESSLGHRKRDYSTIKRDPTTGKIIG